MWYCWLYRQKNAGNILLDELEKLEYRGYDSAGIAVANTNKIQVVKCKGKLANLRALLQEQGMPQGTLGIGHTRWATHGEPSDINSHPHCQGSVTLVHNGIIENYAELKLELQEKGYVFASATDTEVIAALMDSLYKGNPFETIKNALPILSGSYALGILFADQPDRIYAVRKDSPLIIGIAKDAGYLASDIPAILPYTKRYMLMEEGEIALLTENGTEIYDWNQNIIDKEILETAFEATAAEKAGYPHFMLKEIHEQSDVLKKMCSSWERIDSQFIKEQQKEWANIGHLHIVACGSAMHAGLLARYAIEKLAKIPVTVHIASEFRYYPPIFMNGDAVMVISQSGETADTLAALRLAKEKGLATFAVVNVVGSSIAREAQTVFYTYAGPEIAVATTKGYTSQAALLYLFAMQVARMRGLLDEATHNRYLNDLKTIAADLEKPLANNAILTVAQKYADKEHAFFIGRSQDYALCCEGSLKWKEISYIHSEAYAAGELKHGTISLITKETPVVAIVTDPEIAAKTLSNVQESRTRGANITLISTCEVADPQTYSDYFIKLPSVNPLFDGLTVAVVLQKLAYDVANLRGCEIDQPRNLAKSVTVE